MGLRRVQCALVGYSDAAGNVNTAFKGEAVQLSDADEARLDAQVTILAPVGATVADVEARAAQSSREYTEWQTGHGPQPAQRGPRGWQ
jgi:hypothetical protein